MKLIIDASIFITALIGTGVTKEIIFSKSVELYAPEYLFEEFEKHKARIRELSGLSYKEFDEVVEEIKSRLIIVSKEQFEKYLEKANYLIVDKDDTEYIALSLSVNNAPIWSNDAHFKKQLVVEVFNTSELVEYLRLLGYEF